MKRKILFYISQFHKGGAENSLLELIKAINKKHYSIEFIISEHSDVKGAISLVEMLPKNVKICNVQRIKQKRFPLSKVLYKCLFEGKAFDETAVQFVEGKTYDLAVHVGEWHSPEFVALIVKAKKKICWIHGDIDKLDSFNADSFFSFDEQIDFYYFVSQNSKLSAEKKYPFIIKKTGILHNIINTEEIKDLSIANRDVRHPVDNFLMVSVGNIRKEKGYIRTLDAITELKKQGIMVDWWIIGHLSDQEIVSNMNKQIAEHNLEKHISFFGAKQNPYPYMRVADVVLNLSDSESWSLVITEAKTLGIPVIATRTSGATEQIENGYNGILTSFEANEIADDIARIVLHPEELTRIRERLKTDTSIQNTVDEFLEIINRNSEKHQVNTDILYVIDDINFPGGAHYATINHINHLMSQGRKVSIFSSTRPSATIRCWLSGVSFYSYLNSNLAVNFSRKLLPCLLTSNLTASEKKLRITKLIKYRFSHKEIVNEKLEMAYVTHLSSQFDYVCVMSEGSEYKEAVALSSARTKIQWIHTDYASWHCLNDYTIEKTKNDSIIWENYDKIILLSESFINRFCDLFPDFSGKCEWCGNIVDVEHIRSESTKALRQKCKILIFSDGFETKEIKETIELLSKLDKKGFPIDCIFVIESNTHFIVPDLLAGKVIVLQHMNYYGKLIKGKDVIIINSNNKALYNYDLKSAELISIAQGLEKCVNDTIVNWPIKHDISKRLGAIRFISCFRFEPIKQPLVIIEALKRLKDCGYDFSYVFLGDGEQLNASKELVDELGLTDEITFLGQVDNPFPYIARADVFVLFSKYEGLPNTIWEALSLGVPVITSDVGAVSDQVESGKNGYIIGTGIGDLINTLIYIANPDNIEHLEKLTKAAQKTDLYQINEMNRTRLMSVFSS